MRVKVVIIAAGMLIAVLQAQTTAQIFNELKTQPVSVSSSASEPAVGITVSQPAPAEIKPAAKPAVAPDPAPAAIVKETASAVKADDTVETVGVAPEKAGEGAMKGGLVSLSLKGVELPSVIRLFAELSQANIIVPDLGVEAAAVKIDVSLKDVEWKPALQAILDTHDLELYEKIPSSEVYSVRKKLPAAEAVKNTRTFVFRHADITQANEMIKGIVADRGQVYAYPQGNAVVVKTTQEIMDDVAQIAERIDQPRQQVLIEARILELTDNNQKDRGVNWGNDGMGLLNRALSVSPDLQFATGNLGLNTVNPANVSELTLNAGQLKLLMSALDQVSDIQTVSSPKVIVANGETANINILSKIPRVEIQRTTEQVESGAPTTSYTATQEEDGEDPNTKRKRYAEYEFGIRLSVTPTVYTPDNIAVKMVPIISRRNQDDDVIVSAGDVDNIFYAVDEKRVETTFMLANKQTAVIGGLTETTKEDQQTKVPFLSSIPLIRHLFTYTSTDDVQKENVIFVTVSLEDGQNFDVEKAVKQSPLTRKQLIRDDNKQIVDDRAVELFKAQDGIRTQDEIKVIERKK